MNNRVLTRQLVLNFVVTAAIILVLLKADLLSYVAYSVEKGRLRAVREQLPTGAEVAEASMPARNVARTVLPAVVFIETEGPSPNTLRGIPLEELLNELGEPSDDERDRLRRREFLEEHLDRMGRQSALGSGFVTDASNGFIVTNHHVIENADSVTVHLPDGRRYPAKVVGEDPLSDLAVIQIEADRLFEVPFGDSDAIEPGDEVFTLGSPFGLTGTVSRGIVSGTGRSSVNVGGVLYQNFLQTDAVINPGNSGGPLVNLRGEVVGVNTAIATRTGGYNGVGFAIPSSRVTQLLPKLMRGERVVRGFLGVAPRSVADTVEQAAELGWEKNYGVLVMEVTPGSAALAAGLRENDILARLNGMRLAGAYHLIESIGQMLPDTVVTLDVWRDGHEMAVTATLGERPEQPRRTTRQD